VPTSRAASARGSSCRRGSTRRTRPRRCDGKTMRGQCLLRYGSLTAIFTSCPAARRSRRRARSRRRPSRVHAPRACREAGHRLAGLPASEPEARLPDARALGRRRGAEAPRRHPERFREVAQRRRSRRAHDPEEAAAVRHAGQVERERPLAGSCLRRHVHGTPPAEVDALGPLREVRSGGPDPAHFCLKQRRRRGGGPRGHDAALSPTAHRSHVLGEHLLATLRAYWRQRPPRGPYLFPRPGSRQPVSQSALGTSCAGPRGGRSSANLNARRDRRRVLSRAPSHPDDRLGLRPSERGTDAETWPGRKLIGSAPPREMSRPFIARTRQGSRGSRGRDPLASTLRHRDAVVHRFPSP
jgi:hypothetical protein